MYSDLWMTAKQRKKLIRQGIDDSQNINMICIGRDITNISAKAVSSVYGNKFAIPLDIEIFKNLPYANLQDEIIITLHFKPYSNVIIDEGVNNAAPDGKYTIKNISLEYDIIEHAGLAAEVRNSFSDKTYPYTKIHRLRIEHFTKKDNWLNIDVNAPTVSLQALCLLFIDPKTRKPYQF